MERVLSLKQGDILPLTSDLTPDFLFPIPRKKADAPVGRSYFTFGLRRSLRTDIQRFPVTGWFITGSGDMNRMSIRMSRNMDNVVVRAGREYEITDRRLFN